MQKSQEINVNVKETVEHSVAGNREFHFYVDELTSNNYMPTYAGRADEKYTFDEMDDGFFEFLTRKAGEDGIYIRLVFACGTQTSEGAVFQLEYGDKTEEFSVKDTDDVLVFEFADFGVKVKNGEVTFGATIDGGCGQTPYFAEFGSGRVSEEFISLENPLNKRVIEIIEGMII